MWVLSLLLAPIWLVLAWIHLRVVGSRRSGLDALIITAPLALALITGFALLRALNSEPGLWGEIMAALCAYLVLATGFGLGISMRYQRYRPATEDD